jgi:tRNA U34 5-methylaminomethyl-2-thiouridine-forming methyltransferase MnmC
MPPNGMDIFKTQDGSHSLYSAQYGVPYHSKYGAIQESLHVFLEAGLHYRLPSLERVHILEMGFGSGLNAFLAQRVSTQTEKSIHYTAAEAYPLEPAAAKQLNYPELLQEPTVSFLALHTAEWGKEVQLAPHFTLLKKRGKLEELSFAHTYDVIFFDAFAPSAQPELWTEDVFAKLFALTAPKGVLVTYCAKGAVKRALKAVGYTVEGLPGPPGKREMTRASRA